MGERQGILLAAPYSEKKLNKWLADQEFVLGQHKLNGERMKWEHNQLWSSEGNIVTGVPHIVAELKERFPGVSLDGEAYCHGMSFQTIHGIVSRELSTHPDVEQMKYHVFDQPVNLPQYIRTERLIKNQMRFANTKFITLEQTFAIKSVEGALTAVNSAVNDGYEGLVIRHPAGIYKYMSRRWMMKWKPKSEDVYEIVELIEGESTGKFAGTLGALAVKSREGRQFHVGSFKLNNAERDYMWKNRDKLVGAKCVVRYVALSEFGVPPSSVFIRLAIDEAETECESCRL